MRITLHDYVTDPLLTQKDGVNLAHENIATLMKSEAAADMDVIFHDFNRLLRDEEYAREVLSSSNCVVSNIGPHAHYYFYLRDKYDLDFRIIRDVRTAIWSSYLLQEHLCAPFLRDEDILMVASHYTRGIYEKIFPHLKKFTTIRCYPLSVAFPPTPPPRSSTGGRDGSSYTLGYIGRMSEDKNFPDLVRLLITVNQQKSQKFKLVVCGDVHSPSCHPDRVQQQVSAALGAGDYFEYLPPRSNGDIWDLYSRFDTMIFPSTSNLETLGRVLIEASYARVPVICGAHAAAPELMPANAICRVTYNTHQVFSTHYDHSLGRVSIDEMANVLTGGQLLAPDCHLDYLTHPEKFLRIMHQEAANQMPANEDFVLACQQQRFIDSLVVELPQPVTLAQSSKLIARFIPWFLTLQEGNSLACKQLQAELLAISRHPERTARFLDKSGLSGGDFTNVGGIDIELCHVAGFYPEFHIKE